MKYIAWLFVLLMLGTGCDSYREFAGPEPEDESETPEQPGPVGSAYKVTYLVEGTYASCQITYKDHTRTAIILDQAVRLPWSLSFKAHIDSQTGPFEASLSATCADPDKLGKSTAAVLVEDVVKASASAVGFGATAKVDHTVWQDQ